MIYFANNDLSKETKWRSLILFGQNSATYKFAFAKSLLDQVDSESTIVTLDQIALPYANYIIEHLKTNVKQGNSESSKFLTACRSRLNGEIEDDELHKQTVRHGFENVVDAFQNLRGGRIENPFYEINGRGMKRNLVITDQLLSLKEQFQYENLRNEIESRWRLVETAWERNISPNLLEVEYDDSGDFLFIQSDVMRRVDVTSARDALNGYQKGKCFYCCDDISVIQGSSNLCHVDHFLPHAQKREHLPANINGVWNLVLACQSCNSAKSDRVTTEKNLERLNKRNEFYISSKLPLAETIVNQTGKTSVDRKSFLRKHFQIARDYNQTALWTPDNPFPCSF